MLFSRSLVFAALAAGSLLIAGCSNGPAKIDASSREVLQSTTAKVHEALPAGQQAAFTEAIQTIVTRDIADAIEQGGLFNAAATLPTDPEAMFRRVAEQVNGKTGPEIIAQADAIKQERATRQKRALQEQITGLEKEIAAAAATQAAAQTKLQKIVISGARFEWTKSGFLDGPVVDFSIENAGDVALKRVFLHGLLETVGRSVPWVDEDFNYEFRGGLEPGETQHLRLDPNRYGAWGNDALSTRKDLVLTVTVTDFENADGERVVGSDASDIEAKRKQLDDAQEKLTAIGGV